eukprot:767790-Hanusia_phi.AAC.4
MNFHPCYVHPLLPGRRVSVRGVEELVLVGGHEVCKALLGERREEAVEGGGGGVQQGELRDPTLRAQGSQRDRLARPRKISREGEVGGVEESESEDSQDGRIQQEVSQGPAIPHPYEKVFPHKYLKCKEGGGRGKQKVWTAERGESGGGEGNRRRTRRRRRRRRKRKAREEGGMERRGERRGRRGRSRTSETRLKRSNKSAHPH